MRSGGTGRLDTIGEHDMLSFPRPTRQMEVTGERHVTGEEGENEILHHLRYLFALQFCHDRDVLDVACGEGYGTALLAQAARTATGVDVSAEAVAFAAEQYARDNLRFMQGDCRQLPLEDASVDVVVSFETIEHIREHEQFADEVCRVLRPGGLFICSTPETRFFMEAGVPMPYHLRELRREEFLELLRARFGHVGLWGQQLLNGATILPADDRDAPLAGGEVFATPGDGTYQADPGLSKAPYLIAVASEAQVPPARCCLLDHKKYNIFLQHLAWRKYYDADQEAQRLRKDLSRVPEMATNLDELAGRVASIDQRAAVLADVRKDVADVGEQLAELRDSDRASRSLLSAMAERVNAIWRDLPQLAARVDDLAQSVSHLQASHRRPDLPAAPATTPRRPGLRGLARRLTPRGRRVFAQARQVRDSGLFDEAWYLRTYPDVAAAGADAAEHYVRHGWRDGRDPGPQFSTAGYLSLHPHLVSEGVNPLLHFLRHRRAQERFDEHVNRALFRAEAPEVPVDAQRAANTRLIAFYLPQYHPIPENDRWWGRGFTEWTNVSTGRAAFPGHDQPRRPGELGYYDLRVPETRRAQADLARTYGVHGFCYYYYWFNGRRLLERPLEEVFASGQPDLPFCICWANENWTRAWDGLTRDVLMEQRHSLASDVEFLRDVLPLMRDERYIRVDGKPLLVVYRPELMVDPPETARAWRDVCDKEGIGEIQLAMALFRQNDPRQFGFDAAIEFPPHYFPAPDVTGMVRGAAPEFHGAVMDYPEGVRRVLAAHDAPQAPTYPGVMPGWDNTARRRNHATIFHGATPELYEKWLRAAINRPQPDGRENLVFINAWNEWAEGACLEPDARQGRAYLEATFRAVHPGRDLPQPDEPPIEVGSRPQPAPADNAPPRLPMDERLKQMVRGSHLLTQVAYRWPKLSRGTLRLLRQVTGANGDARDLLRKARGGADIKVRWRKRPGGTLKGSRPALVFVSHDAALAGAQLVVLNLIEALASEGRFEPFLLLLEGGEIEHRFFRAANTINVADYASAAGGASAALAAAVREAVGVNPVLALCNTVVASEAAEAFDRAGVPVVSLVHELVTSVDGRFGASRMRQVVEHSRRVVLVSEFSRRAFLDAYDLDAAKLTVVHPGFLPHRDQASDAAAGRLRLRRRWGVIDDGRVVLGCGSVHPRKGPDLFIQVARAYRRRTGDADTRFVWVGNGEPEMVRWCQHDCQNMGMTDTVLFAGQMDSTQEAFAAADVFALTSREDPFPLVCLEAMSHGVPVVAFDAAGGAPEALGDQAGLVVGYLDVEMMADAVARLLADGDLSGRLGQAGRRRAQELYSFSGYVAQLRQVVQDAVGVTL